MDPVFKGSVTQVVISVCVQKVGGSFGRRGAVPFIEWGRGWSVRAMDVVTLGPDLVHWENWF